MPKSTSYINIYKLGVEINYRKYPKKKKKCAFAPQIDTIHFNSICGLKQASILCLIMMENDWMIFHTTEVCGDKIDGFRCLKTYIFIKNLILSRQHTHVKIF